MGKKVFITGMGGYIAGVLCRRLSHTAWCERFYGMDVKAPLAKYDQGEFRKMDINAPALVEWVREIKPDVLIHLAFIVDPIPDDALMHRVNVDGTKNALRAAAEAGVPQVLVASSGTAYGVWPDNPVPLKETDEIRPHPTFTYANDKSQVEFLCRDFMREHPDVVMAVIRPCVVYGPLVNNYLSGLLTIPIVTGPRDHNPPLQFVHEEDVAGAIVAILEKGARGAFNIAPPDTITLHEAMAMTRRPSVFLPDWLLTALVKIAWKLQLPLVRAPHSLLDFMRWPWVLDSTRLREEVGYRFRYSTRETVEIMLRAKKILP